MFENSEVSENKGEIQNDRNFKAVQVKELSVIEKFFANYWTKWIHKIKFFIMPLLLIWIGFAAYRASMLDRADEALQRLRSDHWLYKLQKVLTQDMHKASDASLLNIYMVWGVSGLDRSDVDRWDPTDIGKNIYDTEFDMSSEANQQRIVDI